MPRPTALARLLAPALLLASFATSALAQPLDIVIDQFRVRGKLGTSKIGYVVVDVQSGEELAAYNQDQLFIPASNQKLLTSIAALSVLGPTFSFETTIGYDETANRVIITGAGDPAFGDPKLLEQMGMSVDAFAAALVESMVSGGVPAGTEIVIDDRIFDRNFVHETWPKGQLNRWYCAEVSGLSFHTNTLSIFATPQSPGRPPKLTIEPNARWLEIDSKKARSVRKGRHTLWAARKHMTNSISLRGDARHASTPVEVTVHDPPMFFAKLLSQTMETAGIEPASIRLAEETEHLEPGTIIQTVRTNMPTVLERTNTDSQNLYAESLIKRLGHEVTGEPGSWTNGATVVRMVTHERAGAISGKDFIVADGSGMSRENRVTPATIVRLLVSVARDQKTFTPMLESLATPGRGTLKTRFTSAREPLMGEVYAKSGYLKGVSALSGYVVDDRSGRAIAFSVLMNDVPSSVARAWVKGFEEGLVRATDAYLTTGEPARVLGPR